MTSNKTVMTRPAELASFNVAHEDDAIMHEVAIMHEPHLSWACYNYYLNNCKLSCFNNIPSLSLEIPLRTLT